MGFVDFPPTMKLGIEALPTAHLKPDRDPRKRQSRFPAQPRCDRWFVGVAFGSLAQIVLPPLQPFELFPDDPLGLALRAFPLQFAGVMFAQPTSPGPGSAARFQRSQTICGLSARACPAT